MQASNETTLRHNHTVESLITFEDSLAKMWESGRIKKPVHLSGGNEKELLAIFENIAKDDYIFSTHRGHYHALLAGMPESTLIRYILDSPGGSMCIVAPEYKLYGSAIVSGLLTTSVGVASALQREGSHSKVWTFLGDAATDEGSFYEAHRYALGYDLPITFVLEDNQRSVQTPDMVRWGFTTARRMFGSSNPKESKIIYYLYKPTRPHVGTGVRVEF